MTNRMLFGARRLLGAALALLVAGCGIESQGAESETPIVALTEQGSEPVEPDDAFLLIDAAGPLVVVERDPDPDWALGPVEPVGTQDVAPEIFSVTRRNVDLQKLPIELADLTGRDVLVHSPRGDSCRAALGELELVARTERGELELEEPSADEAWDSPASRVVLGSRVGALDPACAGSVWATPSDAPAPLVFGRIEADRIEDAEALEAAALAALRELPEYLGIEQSYLDDAALDESGERAERWEYHDGGSPQIAFWRAGGRTLIGVDANVGFGCGDFAAALWALFEQRDGALVLRAHDRDAPFPTDVFDLEADGRLELASGERLMLPTSEGVAVLDVDVPEYGCPC